MIKLRALTKYLIDSRMVLPEQVDSWPEQVNLDLIWKPGPNGMHLGDMQYTAVIVLERFAANPALLMALVGSWLESNDDLRDGLSVPKFMIEPLDNDLADVELSLEFVEAQHMAEDPNGPIEAIGKTWGLVPFDLWTAEQGEVVSRGRS
ncbi:phage tail protein [Pseudomonas umsongensis]|uniref:phage tail protein n=1 Tax=Pseudomonas umsongensis TaxID=198618 RepID=UPI0003818F41|nr:phage tail protein [Pseudomonas umsongensis]